MSKAMPDPMRITMPRVNKTKFAILGVLSYKPASGYDIKKFCDNNISFFWNENYGHIYPVLKSMEKEGLVIKETEYTEGKPAKNIFTITDKGKSILNRWLFEPTEFQWGRNEFLLQLVFSKDLSSEEIIQKFNILKKSLLQKLDQLKDIEKKIKEDENKEHHEVRKLWYISLRNGIHTLTSKIKWCEESIIEMQK